MRHGGELPGRWGLRGETDQPPLAAADQETAQVSQGEAEGGIICFNDREDMKLLCLLGTSFLLPTQSID